MNVAARRILSNNLLCPLPKPLFARCVRRLNRRPSNNSGGQRPRYPGYLQRNLERSLHSNTWLHTRTHQHTRLCSWTRSHCFVSLPTAIVFERSWSSCNWVVHRVRITHTSRWTCSCISRLRGPNVSTIVVPWLLSYPTQIYSACVPTLTMCFLFSPPLQLHVRVCMRLRWDSEISNKK